jgi:WD40 repeat protein
MTIKIWNPTTGALIQTLTGHTSRVWALTVLQNGNLVSGSLGLVFGLDNTIKIWNPTTGALIQTLTDTSPVCALTVLQNGNLVSGSYDAGLNIKIWG